MAVHKPDEAIAQYLEDKAIGIYDAANATIFLGPVRPPGTYGSLTIPVKGCWILEATGGPAPDHVFGHAYTIRRVALQIRIRGEPLKYIESRDYAQSIYDVLLGAEPSGYFHVMTSQSGPAWIGYDDGDRPEWSINVVVTFQENA